MYDNMESLNLFQILFKAFSSSYSASLRYQNNVIFH